MKKLNKKGFTLIELLAVIVILAILVAVAIPAVTRYLNTAREGTYADNAQAAISVVRNDVISTFGAASSKAYGLNTGACYDTVNDKVLTDKTTEAACTAVNNAVWNDTTINEMLEKKLKTSPYGADYDNTSYVLVKLNPADGSYTYSICLTDGTRGISANEDVIATTGVTNFEECPKPAAAQ